MMKLSKVNAGEYRSRDGAWRFQRGSRLLEFRLAGAGTDRVFKPGWYAAKVTPSGFRPVSHLARIPDWYPTLKHATRNVEKHLCSTK